ncbi:transposase [Ferrimicrobium sp.]|uniref:transposase n=1 Tax=Ferrimicrobium sp. TaxID=2926050 RepID=UPI002636DD6C|nr:transposase [Ferrimicrobium sp.]
MILFGALTGSTISQLGAALAGTFDDHHALLCRQIIAHIDFCDLTITELTQEIIEGLGDFGPANAILCSIPGVSDTTAQAIIAETGGDMSRFPTSGHLCAWAGVAPASYESAGKRRPAGTRHGAPWLRRTLIEAARAAARSRGTYYSAQYARIAKRRGPNRAAVAVAHSMLDTIWHLLTNGTLYVDPGADYFDRRRDPAIQAESHRGPWFRSYHDPGAHLAPTPSLTPSGARTLMVLRGVWVKVAKESGSTTKTSHHHLTIAEPTSKPNQL